MKVYACPASVPAPKPDYRNYDMKAEQKKEDDHKASLKAWLIKQGYTGKNTGETVSFGVGDGCAQYMLGEGRTSILIHLPHGDAYQYRDAQFLPKKEILSRIDGQKKMTAIFSKKKI